MTENNDYVLIHAGTNDINFDTGEQTLGKKKCSACGKLIKSGITWMSLGVTFFGDGICYECFLDIDKNLHDMGM